jgi:hypothetical protein
VILGLLFSHDEPFPSGSGHVTGQVLGEGYVRFLILCIPAFQGNPGSGHRGQIRQVVAAWVVSVGRKGLLSNIKALTRCNMTSPLTWNDLFTIIGYCLRMSYRVVTTTHKTTGATEMGELTSLPGSPGRNMPYDEQVE